MVNTVVSVVVNVSVTVVVEPYDKASEDSGGETDPVPLSPELVDDPVSVALDEAPVSDGSNVVIVLDELPD